jgi:hypothetical protein
MPVRGADAPASFRIAPARRDRAQAVCRSNSPPIPYLNATIAATTASKLATAPGAVEGISTRVCRSAIASPTGIGRLNPAH